DGVEFPKLLAGTHVVGACRALVVLIAHRREAFAEGGADEDDVADDRRRRVEANFASGEIGLDLLVGVGLQIYPPIVTERWDALAGLGIERHEPITRRHI